MSQYDRDDHDVISMCNNNPNRTGVRRHLGYACTDEELRYLLERDRKLADYEASQRLRQGRPLGGAAFMVIAVLVVIGMTVAALLG